MTLQDYRKLLFRNLCAMAKKATEIMKDMPYKFESIRSYSVEERVTRHYCIHVAKNIVTVTIFRDDKNLYANFIDGKFLHFSQNQLDFLAEGNYWSPTKRMESAMSLLDLVIEDMMQNWDEIHVELIHTKNKIARAKNFTVD